MRSHVGERGRMHGRAAQGKHAGSPEHALDVSVTALVESSLICRSLCCSAFSISARGTLPISFHLRQGRKDKVRMTRRFVTAMLAIVMLICSAARVQADTIGVTEAQLASGKPQFAAPHGTGTNPFGYDWDSAKPNVVTGSAPAGYGPNSFGANVNQFGATQADRYRTFRVSRSEEHTSE